MESNKTHLNSNQNNFSYQLLANSIPAGIAVYEISDSIRALFISDWLCDMWGYTRDELTALFACNLSERIHPDDINQYNKLYEQSIHDVSPFNLSFRIKLKNGSYKYFDLKTTLIEKHDNVLVSYAIYTDIDDLKNSENALRFQQKKYNLALLSSNIEIWEYDVINRCSIHDPKTSKIKHIPTVIQNMPDTLIENGAICPESIDDYRRLHEDVIQGKPESVAEIKAINGNNEYVWYQMHFSTIYDKQGKPLKAIVCSTNISQTKLLQEKYNEEIRYQSVLDSEDLITKARVNTASDMFELFISASKDEMNNLPRSYSEYILGLAEKCLTENQKVSILNKLSSKNIIMSYQNNHNDYNIEYQYQQQENTYIWVRTLIKTFLNPVTGDVIFFLYTYNINREKILNSVIDKVIQQDYDFIIYINANTGAYECMINAASQALFPDSKGNDFNATLKHFINHSVIPAERDRLIKELSPDTVYKALESSPDYYVFYTAKLEPNNTARKKIHCSYVDKEAKELLFTEVDITNIYEEEQRQKEILTAALSSAEQANAAKTDFMSRMSHEIRTPMNAIMGMAAIAAKSIGNDTQLMNCINKINTSSHSLLSLINDILDMNRIESGKFLLNNDEIPFEEFIMGVNSACVDLAQLKNINYEFIVDNSIEVSYMGDAIKLHQIFTNIISNAVKFTDPGGRVSCHLKQRSKTEDDAVLVLTVNDTGCGIDEDFMPHIFEPFAQEYSGITSKYGGTGLGLSISKCILDLMNGKITIHSIKGIGTEVTVVFGLGLDKENIDGIIPDFNFSGLKVLIVDDDFVVCEQAMDTLHELGVTSDWIDSGLKAIELIRNMPDNAVSFDVIFIDWKMPDIDGIETIKQLRSILKSETRLVLITAYDWQPIETTARLAGANMLLSKPLFKSSFASVFRKYIHNSELYIKPSFADYNFSGKRVLLTEDHPLNTEVATLLLKRKGFIVDHACNGLVALEMFGKSPAGYYDVILMDIRMPVMDGLQTASNIRHMSKSDAKTIPIIAMTANAFESDVEKSQEAGMNAHLAKPIEPAALYRTLYNLIYIN